LWRNIWDYRLHWVDLLLLNLDKYQEIGERMVSDMMSSATREVFDEVYLSGYSSIYNVLFPVVKEFM
jgi:hypothetical protein